jgi:hypothetical protein
MMRETTPSVFVVRGSNFSIELSLARSCQVKRDVLSPTIKS